MAVLKFLSLVALSICLVLGIEDCNAKSSELKPCFIEVTSLSSGAKFLLNTNTIQFITSFNRCLNYSFFLSCKEVAKTLSSEIHADNRYTILESPTEIAYLIRNCSKTN